MQQTSRTRQRQHLSTATFYQTLGKTLKAARERKNIQYAELEQQSRLHPVMLRLIEEGKVEVSAATLHVLCSFYDVSITSVLEKVEEQVAALEAVGGQSLRSLASAGERADSGQGHGVEKSGQTAPTTGSTFGIQPFGTQASQASQASQVSQVSQASQVFGVQGHPQAEPHLVPEEELEELIALLKRVKKADDGAFLQTLLQTIITRK